MYTQQELESKSDGELSLAMLKIKTDNLAGNYRVSERDGIARCLIGTNGCGYTAISFDINNPSDMMPLVFERKISLSPIQPYTIEHNPLLWCASCELNDGSVECWHEKPLRACAIVYLLGGE